MLVLLVLLLLLSVGFGQYCCTCQGGAVDDDDDGVSLQESRFARYAPVGGAGYGADDWRHRSWMRFNCRRRSRVLETYSYCFWRSARGGGVVVVGVGVVVGVAIKVGVASAGCECCCRCCCWSSVVGWCGGCGSVCGDDNGGAAVMDVELG